MGKKIFVSYKYADNDVKNLPNVTDDTTVRNYVDILENDFGDNIYKGESEGEDLSALSENTIWEKLKTRIYDSTVTIVLISPNMKDLNRDEKDQWIPWEISYSLREMPRQNKNGDKITSHRNAILAVILPDKDGSYAYFVEENCCCTSRCVSYKFQKTFEIIQKNSFNKKQPNDYLCDQNSHVHPEGHSYIQCVKWSDFRLNMDRHIESAVSRQEKIDDYNIHIALK